MAVTFFKFKSLPMDRWAVLLVFYLMPLTFVSGFLPLPSSVFGPESWLSVWLWLPVTLVSAAAFFQHPPARRAVRSLLPFLGFVFWAAFSLLWTEDLETGLFALGRLATFALVYLAGWTATRDPEVVRRIKAMSLVWILVITIGYLISRFLWEGGIIAVEPDRVMGAAALNLVVLFVVASVGRSPGNTVAIGLIALLATLASDARMVSVVLIGLLVLSPSWVVPRFVRPVVGLAMVAFATVLLSISLFGANWWFISGQGATAANERLDLGGRGELWPAVVDRCEGTWLIGSGVGSSSVYASAFRPTADEPYNEYLRVMCDNGVVGSAALGLFVVTVGIRATRSISRTKSSVSAAVASLQLLAALLLLGITDIPFAAVVQFLAPAAVIWAWSDRLYPSADLVSPLGPARRG